MLTPWKESYDQPRQQIKKQRHYFVNKGPSSQGYGFSSSHVWMWELNCKESWVAKNWFFWTVVLEKTVENSLDCKEIKPVNPKGDQSWVFIGRTDAEAETPIIWPLHVKSWLTGKDPDAGRDWGQGEKAMTEDEMARWHHQLDGHEFGWTPEVGDGQGGLACCNSWSCKESDTTEWLNWTEPGIPRVNPYSFSLHFFFIQSHRCTVQFSSVTQLCLTLCDPMDCSMPGFPIHHQLLELIQTHVHRVGDAIQPSHPLSSPSPPAFNLSQHQGLFQWVRSSHQVDKVLEFQLQHQSFQWIFRTDFL